MQGSREIKTKNPLQNFLIFHAWTVLNWNQLLDRISKGQAQKKREKDHLTAFLIYTLGGRWSVLFLYSVYKQNIYKINDPYLHPCWKKTKLWQRCTPWNYMCYVHEQRVKTFKCIKVILRPKICLAGGRPGIGRLGPRRTQDIGTPDRNCSRTLKLRTISAFLFSCIRIWHKLQFTRPRKRYDVN